MATQTEGGGSMHANEMSASILLHPIEEPLLLPPAKKYCYMYIYFLADGSSSFPSLPNDYGDVVQVVAPANCIRDSHWSHYSVPLLCPTTAQVLPHSTAPTAYCVVHAHRIDACGVHLTPSVPS